MLKLHGAILADVPAGNCHLHNILASFRGIFMKLHNVFVLFGKVLVVVWWLYVSFSGSQGLGKPWKLDKTWKLQKP